jgi:hypothetical protein
VPLFFARALGFSTLTLTATATAGAFGGSTPPLDVMIILDTTASMNNGDTSCGAGETRIGCAVKGVQTLLAELQSTSAWVGLMVFPGVTSATVGDEYCSPKGTVKTVAYNATSPAPVYQIIGNSTSLSTDYNTSGKSGLNTSSNLVGAVGGASSCTGVQAIGGYGTYYPDVIAQAQSTLVSVSAARLASTGQQAQNVIIFVSDGDAGAASGSYPAGDPTLFKATGDCQMAVNEAKTVATAGTWVYAVSYGSPTAPAPTSCATDKAPMSACLAMQEIASDATKFYSDAQGVTGGCSSASNGALSSLQNIFTYIGNGLATARLIPNGTT